MPAPLLKAGEVSLGGVTLPVIDTIQEALVSVFPGRIVQGDPTRADDPLASSYVLSDWSGGILKKYAEEDVDFDRAYWSTCCTEFSRQLSLGRRVVEIELIDDVADKHAVAGCEYDGVQYVAFDDTIVSISSDRVMGLIGTVTGTVTDMKVYRNMTGTDAGESKLVIAWDTGSASGLHTYDGSSLAVMSGETGLKLEVWDNKLVKLDETGTLETTTDLTGAWSSLAGGVVPLPQRRANALLVFPNADGDDALHIATEHGLYFYDDSASLVKPTKFVLPRVKNQGRASTTWQDNLYFGGGSLAVARYTGSTTSQEGLNKDDGLLGDYRGVVRSLSGSLNFLIAALEATSPVPPSPLYRSGGAWASANTIYKVQGYSVLLAKPGTGWHTLYASDTLGSGCKWAGVSSAHDTYRLWFGLNGGLYTMELATDIHNILQNSIQEYQASGVLWTPWADANWSEIDKLALRQKFGAKNAATTTCTGTACNLVVQYQLGDAGDDAAWTSLTTLTLNPGGTYETEKEVSFGSGLGTVYTSIRYKLSLTRCSDVTHSPVLLWSTLVFLKDIEARYGYRFEVDCTKKYGTRTPEELASALRELAETGTLLEFYGWVEGEYVKRNVKVATLSGEVAPGSVMKGIYGVSVVAV